MSILRKLQKRIHRDEKGQSTLEYILILFAVVILAVKFKQVIVDKVRDATENKLGAQIDKALEE